MTYQHRKKVVKAVPKTHCGKSSWPDGIQSEVLKTGGTSLIEKFTGISMHLLWWWFSPTRHENVPNGSPFTSDNFSCNNFREVSFIRRAGKILPKVILYTFNTHLLGDILAECQCGFRKNRDTVDMIWYAKFWKNAKSKIWIYVLFVDLIKNFVTLSRPGLWKILRRIGIPQKMVNIIRWVWKIDWSMAVKMISSP